MLETKYLQENVKNIQLLMTIPGLRHFEARKLGGLLRLSRIRQYEPGETIIEEGADDPWLYFLLNGSVKVVKDGVVIAMLEKAGELFGEMRLIAGGQRSASVQALKRTCCLAVDISARDRLHQNDDRTDLLLFLYRMFAEYTSARLKLTNDELIQCKKRLASLERDCK